MDDNERYLLEINKDNLARTISFAGAYDSKANFGTYIHESLGLEMK